MPISDFSNFFKADWKHTNIEIRLRALDRLAAYQNQNKASKIIQKVAENDRNYLVKEKAILLLGSPEIVSEILAKTEKASQKELLQLVIEKVIIQKCEEIGASFDLAMIEPWLKLFVNEYHLKNLFHKTSYLSLNNYILENIIDLDLAFDIYLENQDSEENLKELIKKKISSYPEYPLIIKLEKTLVELQGIKEELVKGTNDNKATILKQKVNTLTQNWKSTCKKLEILNLKTYQDKFDQNLIFIQKKLYEKTDLNSS